MNSLLEVVFYFYFLMSYDRNQTVGKLSSLYSKQIHKSLSNGLHYCLIAKTSKVNASRELVLKPFIMCV